MLDELEPKIERILTLQLKTEEARAEHAGFIMECLEELNSGIDKVKAEAGDYPNDAMPAEIWGIGTGYIACGHALTDHFSESQWLEHEANASGLWAKAALSVCSHYHDMVGPAMIANADCCRRLGDIDHAKNMWASVVKDFVFLLDGFENDPDGPTDDDRVSIESLHEACTQLQAAGVGKVDTHDLGKIIAFAGSVLARPAPVEDDDEEGEEGEWKYDESDEDDGDEFVHPEVLWMCGGDRPGSLNEVIGLLDGDDLDWRRIAAYELGNYNEPHVVEKLHGLLGDPDLYVRLCSVQALANLEDKTAVEPLCEMLKQADTEYEIRTNIIKALGEIRDSRALPALYPLLESENAFVRFDTAFALGEIGDPAAVPYLKAIVSDDTMPEPEDDGELADSTSWSVGESAQKAIDKILGAGEQQES